MYVDAASCPIFSTSCECSASDSRTLPNSPNGQRSGSGGLSFLGVGGPTEGGAAGALARSPPDSGGSLEPSESLVLILVLTAYANASFCTCKPDAYALLLHAGSDAFALLLHCGSDAFALPHRLSAAALRLSIFSTLFWYSSERRSLETCPSSTVSMPRICLRLAFHSL